MGGQKLECRLIESASANKKKLELRVINQLVENKFSDTFQIEVKKERLI